MLYQVKEPEIWAPMHGYEKEYKVSTLGRIMGIARWSKPRILSTKHKRYQAFQAHKDKQCTLKLVHRVVAETFLGPKPGLIVRHLDGNPQNNKLRNLAWGTHKDNEADKFRHGTAIVGKRNPQTKISDDTVRKIRALGGGRLPQGASQRYAKQFGVTLGSFSDIRRGKSRKYVK